MERADNSCTGARIAKRALRELSQDPFGETATVAAKRILAFILINYHGPVAVRLWNGDMVIGNKTSPCTIIFRHPAPLRDLVLHKDLVRLAEYYLAGELDVEGDIEALFDLKEYLRGLTLPLSARLQAIWHALLCLPSRSFKDIPNSVSAGRDKRRNSHASIAHHYDISNKFYQLWLDPEMVYSCAYFQDSSQSLAAAQHDKLDIICRKLMLAPGQTLLDIGCGWGGLVCWAAKQYGVQAHGITLSRQQHTYAMERVRKEGLIGRVVIELQDYRELPKIACYDRVVSVGMFEHIGISNFQVYFSTVKQVLKQGGLFLNHGIATDTGWPRTPITRFMNRYVFPDGELARISDVINSMEKAGFNILDVEGMRRHYTLTLRHWGRALEAHRDQAVKLVGEATYRVWRLYMAGSAYFFNKGCNGVYQVLAGHARQPLSIPLRRDHIYKNTENHQTLSEAA